MDIRENGTSASPLFIIGNSATCYQQFTFSTSEVLTLVNAFGPMSGLSCWGGCSQGALMTSHGTYSISSPGYDAGGSNAAVWNLNSTDPVTQVNVSKLVSYYTAAIQGLVLTTRSGQVMQCFTKNACSPISWTNFTAPTRGHVLVVSGQHVGMCLVA